jgi:hypothetical protein
MLKMPCSFVLASLRGSTYGNTYASLASLLAAALPQGVLNILRGHDGI